MRIGHNMRKATKAESKAKADRLRTAEALCMLAKCELGRNNDGDILQMLCYALDDVIKVLKERTK